MTATLDTIAKRQASEKTRRIELGMRLRADIRNLKPEHARELRNAYQDAASGLTALLSLTEDLDLELRPTGDEQPRPLIDAHLAICEALTALRNSGLGDAGL